MTAVLHYFIVHASVLGGEFNYGTYLPSSSFFRPKMRLEERLLQEITGLAVVIERNYWRTGDAAHGVQ